MEDPDPLAEQTLRESADALSSEALSPSIDEAALNALAERVGRLEEGLAEVRDTASLESRIVTRVLEQVGRDRPSGLRESAGLMLDAGRRLLPVAAGALQAQAAALEARADAAPPARPWLIADLWADVRTLARMARDPLYRTIWLGRALVPLGLLVLILTSWVWLLLIPGLSLLPDIASVLLVKVVDLFLAFVLCKVLQREIRRYRATLPDPSPPRPNG